MTKEEILRDYSLAYQSRQASLLGRREVLTGKAKFGIFGDGKELPQIALAKFFQNGDIRSGYYRDQTFAFITGMASIDQFFSQLYADPDLKNDPHSGGRQMNSHFATRLIRPDGSWEDMTQLKITAADASPTASQMPRITGLVQASRLFRQVPELKDFSVFSDNGNEVVFGTIGNASCAEGLFWETINAIGVIQGPFVMSIWDDEYGISVPNEFQITKKSLSEMLSGFQRTPDDRGYDIYTVKAWDYETLIEVYRVATENARIHHIPAIVHVTEVTQPQGHSTSGSHERYKSPERLKWEKDHDCITKLREYIIEKGYATDAEIDELEKEDRRIVRKIKNDAWQAYQDPIKKEVSELLGLIGEITTHAPLNVKENLRQIAAGLKRQLEPARRDVMISSLKVLFVAKDFKHPTVEKLAAWRRTKQQQGTEIYGSFLYSESPLSPRNVAPVAPVYSPSSVSKSGFEILNMAFEEMFSRNPLLVAFGEDVGQLGDVNQGFAGLQEKFGPYRVMDTGIREATIAGQAIGLAMRGLRPIAEIQYLDYFIYALQTLSDDLATLLYRTKGGQRAPAIIRTRGHRLEGIWHAGSPLAMMIHSLRGIHIAVPRDMTRAVGFYHTFLQGDDPAVIIEVLNGYRLKEKMPDNLSEIRIAPGIPEVLREGKDVTIVTYGACCRVALQAATQLEEMGISTEIIDVQTLLPFDIHHSILDSLKKTNRIVFLDEDVPGGATAYMMQEVLEKQGGYYHLDSEPRTLTAKAHRPAYGDDGDYFSKPQAEDIFQTVYTLMHESDPPTFPMFF
ncbi:MAG: thiamine pyrophosphate-dependent enzyme [Bacteroidia bacterium]|nr:thiamine pyrophosphate-dependent enzyme [Bacteroidia bacterium]